MARGEKKKGVVARFFDGMREKFEAIVKGYLESGETLLDYGAGQTSPSEIFSVIPILATWHKLKTRHWIVALTDRRVLLLRHPAMSAFKILEVKGLPLARVRSMTMKKGVLFVSLVVQTSSGTLTFKEMEKDEVQGLIARFKSAKRGAAAKA